jgi:hypothetical protein
MFRSKPHAIDCRVKKGTSASGGFVTQLVQARLATSWRIAVYDPHARTTDPLYWQRKISGRTVEHMSSAR